MVSMFDVVGKRWKLLKIVMLLHPRRTTRRMLCRIRRFYSRLVVLAILLPVILHVSGDLILERLRSISLRVDNSPC